MSSKTGSYHIDQLPPFERAEMMEDPVSWFKRMMAKRPNSAKWADHLKQVLIESGLPFPASIEPPKKPDLYFGNILLREDPLGWLILKSNRGVFEEIERIRKSVDPSYHDRQRATAIARAKAHADNKW